MLHKLDTQLYTDGQGKSYTGNDKFISYLKDANGTVVEVTANQAPAGTFAMTGQIVQLHYS